jgi:hypothetical protein
MPEVVPPAQADVEFLRDRANIALQGIARIQRNSTTCMEDPLAGVPQSFQTIEECRRNRNSASGIPALVGVDLAVVHAALHIKNIALEIRPLDRDGFSDTQSRYGQEQHQRGVGLGKPLSNRSYLRRTEDSAMNSTSCAVLRPRQFHSFAGIFLQPLVPHGMRQQKTEQNPHVSLSWSVIGGKLASFWEPPDSLSQFGDNFNEHPSSDTAENYACHHDGKCELSRIHYDYLDPNERNPVSAEWRDADGNLRYAAYYEYEIDIFRNWTYRQVWVWTPELIERKLLETDSRTITYWQK